MMLPKSRFFNVKCTAAIVCAGVATAGSAQAGSLEAITDALQYSGVVSTYDSLDDAQQGQNATGTYNVDTRDMSLYETDSDSVFMTSWYYTTNQDHGEHSGWGNPNNTNTGFIQMYDLGADTRESRSGGWGDSSFTQFDYSMSGSGAGADQVARWWHAPGEGGPAYLTAGTFHEYELNVSFTFDGGADVTDMGDGTYRAEEHHTDASGSLTAIFENESGQYGESSYDGTYYAIDLSVFFDPETHWAWSNMDDLNGEFFESYFQGSVIPLPAPVFMGLAGLAGVAVLRRRQVATQSA